MTMRILIGALVISSVSAIVSAIVVLNTLCLEGCGDDPNTVAASAMVLGGFSLIVATAAALGLAAAGARASGPRKATSEGMTPCAKP